MEVLCDERLFRRFSFHFLAPKVSSRQIFGKSKKSTPHNFVVACILEYQRFKDSDT